MLKRPNYEQFEYTPRDQRELPDEDRVVFFLRPLRWREVEALELGTRFRQAGEGQIELVDTPLTKARKILDIGLLGWRGEGDDGFRCERRKEGKREVLTDEVLDAIHPWALELANAIEERSAQTADDRKNS